MIKYLGSKRQLIPWILKSIQEHFPKAQKISDIFSGTSRVGFALKQNGYSVFSNDHNQYAFHIARCYIETSTQDLPKNFPKIIDHLNNLPGKHDFFTENYCIKARFFHPKNGKKIDSIRKEIDNIDVSEKIKSVLLVSLMEAADRTDSTCGIQMAYLKDWAPRAHLELKLRPPQLSEALSGNLYQAYCLDAIEAAAEIKSDVAYLDPPYNQHSYRGNYHIWETLVRNDRPKVYGLTNKREDCQTTKSSFNSKPKFQQSLQQVISSLNTKNIVLSFSNEGFISQENIEKLLSNFGQVTTLNMDYKRYVGAQIGIYNQRGHKVGKIKNLSNKEFLYIVRP